MVQSATIHNPLLVNSFGHSAGLLVFGLIVILLLRESRMHGMRQARLSLIAAILALTWNLGSLIAVALENRRPFLTAVIMTASFSALSFLPAVLLQVALRGKQRFLLAAGYVVSTCAVFLHVSELLVSPFAAHQWAVCAVALGFGITLIAALFKMSRSGSVRPPSPAEWISLSCLLLFTTSFLHFGYQHSGSPWAAEVTWHHLGIPVVLIVLLQEYRLLLLDTFSRFLLNLGLATFYLAGLLILVARSETWQMIRQNAFLTGISLAGLCLSLIVFAEVRNALQAWMSRAIFHRRGIDDCRKLIVRLAAAASSEDDFLTQSAKAIAQHMRTDQFAIRAETNQAKKLEFGIESQVLLRFSSGDSRQLIFGTRKGGRRYFSEDLADMRQLGAAIVEQVERLRADELKQLVAQAELRALQAQINPHFLFNALNTLYGTIDRDSVDARRTVLNLADIFRYPLQADRPLVELSQELRIVEAYLEIESLRLEDRLETEIVIPDSARGIMIPILSLQPLVENAVKHGVSPKSGGGRVSLRVERVSAGFRITVEDTGLGFAKSGTRHKDGFGLGLENVRRRLLLCHGPQAELHIQSGAGGTAVSFCVPDQSREENPLVLQSSPFTASPRRTAISAESRPRESVS